MLRLLLGALAISTSWAADDARDIVRRSMNLGDQNLRAAQDYTFQERLESRTLNDRGDTTKTEVEAYDVTFVDRSPYRRLISKDNKPLSAKDEQREQDKLRRIATERRAENAAAREKRLAEDEKKREHLRATMREIAGAFDFRIAGEDNLDGRRQFVIEGTPHPGYHPHTRDAFLFPKVKGRIWIDKQDYHWVKIEGEVIDTVSLGALLLRLHKGSHLEAEQVRINDEVWLPKHFSAEASARIALLKKYRGRLEVTYSDYKKFQADSRIVAAEPR